MAKNINSRLLELNHKLMNVVMKAKTDIKKNL